MGTKAEESKQVRRAREKLRHQLESQAITEEGLAKVRKGIGRWLARTSSMREPLTDKSIVLFDHNQHAAATTQSIMELRAQLARDLEKPQKPASLAGRIKPTE